MPGIGALEHVDARIAAQTGIQLPVTDVDGDDLAGAGLKQAIHESSGRGPNVEAKPAPGVQRQELKGPRFGARPGEKLARALEFFAVAPRGRLCLDVGASTGGFVDCLLQAGAREVIAVDVGYGQLDSRLRGDPRVHVLERTNARHLTSDDLPFAPELVTADVSFISLRKLVPAIMRVAAPGFLALLMLKPQFEAGRGRVGKGGIVRDPQIHE